jgi:hypothetical protein
MASSLPTDDFIAGLVWGLVFLAGGLIVASRSRTLTAP